MAVCVKPVPDTTEIKSDLEIYTMMREGVPVSLAPSTPSPWGAGGLLDLEGHGHHRLRGHSASGRHERLGYIMGNLFEALPVLTAKIGKMKARRLPNFCQKRLIPPSKTFLLPNL